MNQAFKRSEGSIIQIESAVSQLWGRPGFLMRRCLQYTSGHFEQSCAEIGLTTRQFDYLFVLDKTEKIGQTDLANAVGLDRSTNTLVLKILERKGWVRRVAVLSDSRKKQVEITQSGREIYSKAQKAAESSIKMIENALEIDEYQHLIQLMQKVVRSVSGHLQSK